MKQLTKYSIASLCLVLLLTGCVSRRSQSCSGSQYSDPLIISYNDSGNPIYSASVAVGGVIQDRMIAWTASLSIDTPDVTNAVSQTLSILEKSGGYVETRSSDTYSGTTLKLRIPANSFTNAMGSISALGTVTSRRVGNEDVTEQYVDTEARLKNKIVLRDRLRGLLDQATEIKDILAIETELNRVQSDIDSMEARIRSLKGKVDYATLNLTFRLKEEKPRRILGPLGLLFKGVFWTVEKLFVIRE